MTTTGAIIVHHRNFPNVLATVQRLLEEGILPSLLVVIDNSEDSFIASQLDLGLPESSTLEVMPNFGYGAAVNCGVRTLLKQMPQLDYILVSTHETLPAKGALKLLEQALTDDSSLAVVGPTLVTTQDKQPVYWSWGGMLSRMLNEPRHLGHKASINVPLANTVMYRSWVDGAFCLYRAGPLGAAKLREDFFLYFEETELHTRLIKIGYTVGWVPMAKVEQYSKGVPPFLFAQNLQRFQNLHGSILHRNITVPFIIGRRAIRNLLKGGPPKEIRELLSGWRSGIGG